MKPKIPLIARLLFPLIFGIVTAYYTSFVLNSVVLIAILLVLTVMALPVFSQKPFPDRYFGITSSVFFFFLGIYLIQIHDSRYNSAEFSELLNEKESTFKVIVMEPTKETEKTVKVMAEVRAVDDVAATGNLLLYFTKSQKSKGIQYGDQIVVRSRINRVRTNGNPDEFNYAAYLANQDIYYQGFVKDEDWFVSGNEANGFMANVYSMRAYFVGELEKTGMSDENLMVAKALILGEKEDMDPEVQRSFSGAGAMHVLAVSGLHVGIVMLVLSFLLKPLKNLKRGKILFVIAVLCGIWFYALITGLSPSVMRAAVMFSFIIVGSEMQRETSIYQSIMVSAFLLILIDPMIIFSVGFQLSYLAVIGIVFLHPKINNWFYFENRMLNKIWQLSAVSIAAQIATFPLGLFYFHQFPNYFLISNLLVIPLAFLILMAGIIYLATSLIPFVSDLFFYLLDFLLTILNEGVKWIEKLPYSITSGISINWIETLLIYLVIFLVALAFIRRKAKFLMMALSGVVVLCGMNIYEKYEISESNELVIYNVQDDIAIDIFQGDKNVFLSSKEMIKDENKIRYTTLEHWNKRSGSDVPSQFVEFSDSLEIVNLGKKSCFFISDGNVEDCLQNGLPVTDLYYLRNINFIPNEFLDDISKRNKTIVLGDGVGYKVKNYIKDGFSGLIVHDLKNDGAFISEF